MNDRTQVFIDAHREEIRQFVADNVAVAGRGAVIINEQDFARQGGGHPFSMVYANKAAIGSAQAVKEFGLDDYDPASEMVVVVRCLDDGARVFVLPFAKEG